MAVKWMEQDLKLDLSGLRKTLSSRIQSAKTRAGTENHACVACATVALELFPSWCDDAFRIAPLDDSAWYWREPGSDGQTHLALGVTLQSRIMGNGRFVAVSDAYIQARGRLVTTENDQPRWFCGMSFATGPHRGPWQGWPDAVLVLPQFLFACDANGHCSLTVTVEVDEHHRVSQLVDAVVRRLEAVLECQTVRPETGATKAQTPVGPPRHTTVTDVSQAMVEAAWRNGVAEIAADIRAGQYEKVVFARQSVISDTGLQQAHTALRRLRGAYPQSHGFAVQFQDGCFLGASPERLVRCIDGVVSVDCLAGTTMRGEDAAEDGKLGEALLHSDKDRLEHDIVVQWVKRTIADVVNRIPEHTQPVLRKLPNVQHLHTPLQGEAKSGTTIFDLVKRLHPTPAVAGVPRELAMQVIQERENMDRGWYAGPVGWIDKHGNGEFIVALRSALAMPGQTILFAGAGIMGDSDPANEWAETELKLRPMRMAFEQSGS